VKEIEMNEELKAVVKRSNERYRNSDKEPRHISDDRLEEIAMELSEFTANAFIGA
jgi:hypothetical protein